MRNWFLAVMVVGAVALGGAACGGGGDDALPTAVATAEAIDAGVLYQAILTEDDLGEGYVASRSDVGSAGNLGTIGQIAEFVASNGPIYVQSSVVWMPTIADAETSLGRQRGALLEFGWKETNHELEGTQAAFRYTKPGVSALIQLAITDHFVLFVQRSASDPAVALPEVEDADEFDRLNTLVAGRVAAIMAGDVTPVAGAPTAASTPVPDPGAPEATP